MGTLDFPATLDRIADSSPLEVVRLLHNAARPLGATEVGVYLVDFQGMVLEPVSSSPDDSGAVLVEEDVATSMPGRAFSTGQPVSAEGDGSVRVWVPLVERGECTGVVALTLARLDEAILAECVRLGVLAGLLVRSFARTTDLMHLRRRRRPMSLAAGMQWDLLPPLTVRCASATVSGRLEPAYRIAGDAFDYALNDGYLDAAVFDGMGHGVESTLMTTLAVGAYRHARRGGGALEAAHAAIDEVISVRYQGEAFVTAAMMRLGLDDGVLEWTNAGHPCPLLLRAHKSPASLQCAPSLPLGLGDACSEVATEQLQPGDVVLFFTDGVVEGRSPKDGEDYGTERLASDWEREWASGQPPEEVLRRLVTAIIEYNGGPPHDDATLMQLCWFGLLGQRS